MPDHNFVRLTFGDFFGAFIKKEKKFFVCSLRRLFEVVLVVGVVLDVS